MPATIPLHQSAASKPAPTVSVVIVNYNGWDDVIRLAADLAASPEVVAGAADILIVDNASDGPVPASLPASPGVRLIVRPENGGFAAGVNEGARASRSPWLLLLNPDVEIEPGFLGQVLRRVAMFAGRPEGPPGIVGFALKNPDGTPQPSVGSEPGLLRSLVGQFIPRSRRKYQAGWRVKPGPVPWVTGACMLVDASLMATLGGMDEGFFLYYEEVALCLSARKAGRRVEYDASVSVVHLRPLQNRAITPMMRVIVRHAKLRFFRTHLPRWQFVALSRLIGMEAACRGWIARRNRDDASAGAWRAVAAISRWLREGREFSGRDVLLLAESAIGLRDDDGSLQPRSRRPRSSRPPFVESALADHRGGGPQ